MSKDYKGYNSKPKKSRRKRGSQQGSKKPLLWFTVIAVVVLVAFVGYWYLQNDYHPHSKKSKPTPAAKPVAKAQPTAPPKKPSIKFEFYNILTKQTVSVPNPLPAAAPQTPQSTARYIVQVASLKDSNVADSFKAKLALDGFNVHVKPIVNSSGNTWYRVQIGPYNNYDDASDVLNTLRKDNFDGLVKKINE